MRGIMFKLLIADDEPLVQAGIKSMINWDDYDISVIGTAANGALAYDMIQEYSPDIVITDIKMPVMTGLELARKCYEEKRTLPYFIILTSYEEFSYVREAITYQVSDYLIKLELTADTLGEALVRATEKVKESRDALTDNAPSLSSVTMLREQFYTRLILNLFESEQHFLAQAQNLNLDLQYAAFAAGYIEINSEKLSLMPSSKQLSLYTSSLQIAGELISKYIPCHALSLDTRHFCVIFFLEEATRQEYKTVIENALKQVSSMLYNYYSVSICASIGSPVSAPLQISSSYQDAKQIFSQTGKDTPFVFIEDVPAAESLKNVFNISLFKADIRKAYMEFDEKSLYDIFTSIIELFASQKPHYIQALDAAGNILYLSLSLLSDGEQIISDIFADRNNGYRCLYELGSTEQILEWLKTLRDGLCSCFALHNKDYKNHIVSGVKRYINEHIAEKLTLNKVADIFSISPNYLSVLFSKYNDVGFSDYINQTKVEAAKEMLQQGKLKIYEISDQLGFESPFYFSRVFKKVTGLSPRDYASQK